MRDILEESWGHLFVLLLRFKTNSQTRNMKYPYFWKCYLMVLMMPFIRLMYNFWFYSWNLHVRIERKQILFLNEVFLFIAGFF